MLHQHAKDRRGSPSTNLPATHCPLAFRLSEFSQSQPDSLLPFRATQIQPPTSRSQTRAYTHFAESFRSTSSQSCLGGSKPQHEPAPHALQRLAAGSHRRFLDRQRLDCVAPPARSPNALRLQPPTKTPHCIPASTPHD